MNGKPRNGVVHRDLKPENIFLDSNAPLRGLGGCRAGCCQAISSTRRTKF